MLNKKLMEHKRNIADMMAILADFGQSHDCCKILLEGSYNDKMRVKRNNTHLTPKDIMDFAEAYHSEQLRIGIVSQQRELLLDFLKEQEYCGLVEILEDNFEHYVDEYLKDK